MQNEPLFSALLEQIQQQQKLLSLVREVLPKTLIDSVRAGPILGES